MRTIYSRRINRLEPKDLWFVGKTEEYKMHKSLRKLFLGFGTGLVCCSAAFADVFTVEANVLYYDTENSDSTDEIEYGHEEQLLSLLKNNSEIDTLVLNSSGGFVAAAHDMADLVIDAGLNTHVEFNCASACVTIFLAGKPAH